MNLNPASKRQHVKSPILTCFELCRHTLGAITHTAGCNHTDVVCNATCEFCEGARLRRCLTTRLVVLQSGGLHDVEISSTLGLPVHTGCVVEAIKHRSDTFRRTGHWRRTVRGISWFGVKMLFWNAYMLSVWSFINHSPDSICKLVLGGLLHTSFVATALTLYVWPHCRFHSSQFVMLELQVETWPLMERAVAVWLRPFSEPVQSKRAELVKQSRTAELRWGLHGTKRWGEKISVNSSHTLWV